MLAAQTAMGVGFFSQMYVFAICVQRTFNKWMGE